MLDEFLWGRVSRISPEAPVPVVEVTNESASLGGAGNVVTNIRALGGHPVPFGVLGKDRAADRLRLVLESGGMDGSGLLSDKARPTTVKMRIIELSRKHQLVRADRETREPISDGISQRLARGLLTQARAGVFSAVIVSDYDKGTVTSALLAEVLPALDAARVPVFLDPRTSRPQCYKPVTIITPNQREAEEITGTRIQSDESLQCAGQKMLQMLGCPWVLITLGERGMALFGRDSEMRLIATMAREVYDVTGAGDTVIAALALACSAGASMLEAASLANCAAGIAVAHIGTVAPTASELRDALLEGARRTPDHPAWRIK